MGYIYDLFFGESEGDKIVKQDKIIEKLEKKLENVENKLLAEIKIMEDNLEFLRLSCQKEKEAIIVSREAKKKYSEVI